MLRPLFAQIDQFLMLRPHYMQIDQFSAIQIKILSLNNWANDIERSSFGNYKIQLGMGIII